MLTEICRELNNYFETARFDGGFEISNGHLKSFGGIIADGQYYRVVGSVFNDGVHQQGVDFLTDETFTGAVWIMAVPPAVVNLAGEIEDWCAKYEAADSQNMSPYNSESFGGYSYSKGGSTGSANGTWQNAFATRLKPYKRVGATPKVLRRDLYEPFI